MPVNVNISVIRTLRDLVNSLNTRIAYHQDPALYTAVSAGLVSCLIAFHTVVVADQRIILYFTLNNSQQCCIVSVRFRYSDFQLDS